MDRALLKKLPYLPTEIITVILSKLPIRTIVSCKCVCKSWNELLNTAEFANFHLTKSVPGLVTYQNEWVQNLIRVFELKDELDLEQHVLQYDPVAKFDHSAFVSPFHARITMEGSVNGLLFLRKIHPTPDALYICNPITREYIDLPNPPRNPEGVFRDLCRVSYGFGLSKKTDQYKVVQIFHECELEPTNFSLQSILKSECHVYTLGTGSWRSVPLGSSQELYGWSSNVVLINGNLHWLVVDFKKSSLMISCFDLETELFKAFSPPPPPHLRKEGFTGDMIMLGDRLCFSDNTMGDENVIWVMKEYGVEKSWTKEIVIKSEVPFCLPGDKWSATAQGINPVKVFRDSYILLSWRTFSLAYYSNKSKIILGVNIFGPKPCVLTEARLYVCSFLSLKRFAKESIAKF